MSVSGSWKLLEPRSAHLGPRSIAFPALGAACNTSSPRCGPATYCSLGRHLALNDIDLRAQFDELRVLGDDIVPALPLSPRKSARVASARAFESLRL